MHSSTFVVLLALMVVASAFIQGSAMFRPCLPCVGEECDLAPPKECFWGESRDFCNRRVCTKGPGDKCGGKYNIMGDCGEGMYCSRADGKCKGCHIPTMMCAV